MTEIRVNDGVNFDQTVQRVFAHNGSSFATEINRIWGHNGAEWEELWPVGGNVEPLPPGFYVLPASSISIPPSGGPSWALFDTDPFIGRNIIGVDAHVSWKSFGSITGPINGRPTGTFYRNLVADNSFANRTINHQIDAGIAEFIAGTATGYTIGTGSNGNGVFIGNLRLRIEIGP